MLAMQALWSQEVAEFRGEFVRFEPCWQWPKPVQQPRPTVLLGGAPGPTLFAHIAEYADGWIPIGGAGMREALAELRKATEAAGRDFASLRIVPMGVMPSPEKLAYYAPRRAEAVLRLPSAPRAVPPSSTPTRTFSGSTLKSRAEKFIARSRNPARGPLDPLVSGFCASPSRRGLRPAGSRSSGLARWAAPPAPCIVTGGAASGARGVRRFRGSPR
jgi:alkanesulfonate monooxygenase SsuD/methylene tetrahydromethanopterin reductase-like flavin-dependent oxidoreductase (luciferase family)